jgi:hypothetical protein
MPHRFSMMGQELIDVGFDRLFTARKSAAKDYATETPPG